MQDTTGRLIANIEDAIETLTGWIPTEEEAVDVAGDLTRLEKQLATYRRLVMSELSGVEDGERYRALERKTSKRSYNTQGLLAAFTQAGEQIGDTVRALLDADAVRLTWRWTELNHLANDLDVILPVAKHEIGDGDPEALVGEVWSSTISIVTKEAK